MMNKMKLKFNHERFNKDMKRAFTLLTVITNCFIISGVMHHWKPRSKPIYNYTNDYTQLAAPLKEVAEVQQKATGYTSSEETN